MNFLRTFRFRIAGLSVLLSGAILAICAFAAWALTWRIGLEHLDNELRNHARRELNQPRDPVLRQREPPRATWLRRR